MERLGARDGSGGGFRAAPERAFALVGNQDNCCDASALVSSL